MIYSQQIKNGGGKGESGKRARLVENYLGADPVGSAAGRFGGYRGHDLSAINASSGRKVKAGKGERLSGERGTQ